jgi:hypothetical protein
VLTALYLLHTLMTLMHHTPIPAITMAMHTDHHTLLPEAMLLGWWLMLWLQVLSSVHGPAGRHCAHHRCAKDPAEPGNHRWPDPTAFP